MTMRIKLFLLSVAILVFASCTSNKQIPIQSKTDSIYIQKLVPIYLPGDTSVLQALLQCNANGMLAIEKLSIETSKNAQLSFMLDSMGNIKVQTIVSHDTIYLPSDSIRIETTITEVIQVEVEKRQSSWNLFLLRFGRGAFYFLIGIASFGVILTIIHIIKLKR